MRKRTKFTNKRSLKKILKDMPTEVKIDAQKALEQGGDDVVGTMKAIAPVVKGHLKATIRWKNVSNEHKLAVRIQAGGHYGGYYVPYARIVEFHHGSAFFYPAYRAQKRRVKSRITRSVNKATKRVIERNRRGESNGQ